MCSHHIQPGLELYSSPECLEKVQFPIQSVKRCCSGPPITALSSEQLSPLCRYLVPPCLNSSGITCLYQCMKHLMLLKGHEEKTDQGWEEYQGEMGDLIPSDQRNRESIGGCGLEQFSMDNVLMMPGMLSWTIAQDGAMTAWSLCGDEIPRTQKQRF